MANRKVLIADSSAEFCDSIARLLDSSWEVTTCTDGASALKLTHQLRPDVLVIDLILPELDGLSVLKEISSMTPRPACLVTLQFCSSFIERALQNLAVDFVVMKPCNVSSIVGRIQDLLLCPTASVLPSVSELLMALDVPVNGRGFRFLKEAVLLYQSNPGLFMTKDLYPTIAQQCGVSATSVEQAIRRAIHNAWSAHHGEAWAHCFHSRRENPIPKPSNSKFIAIVAEHSLPDSPGK